MVKFDWESEITLWKGVAMTTAMRAKPASEK